MLQTFSNCVTDSSAEHKFLFNVTAFINEMQLFMNDKSNYIKNPISIYKYVHSSCIKLRATPPREAYLYIYACHMIMTWTSLAISLWE